MTAYELSRRRTWIALGIVSGFVALASAAAIYTDLNARQLNRTGLVSGSEAGMASPFGTKSSGVLGEVGGGFASNAAGVNLESGHVPFIPGAPPSSVDDWDTLQQK